MKKVVKPRVALFDLGFNPPGVHHRSTVEVLVRKFDKVIIIPCGPRPDKATTNDIDPIHRAIMTDITFRDMAPNVAVELFDLENRVFTRTHVLEKKFAREGEVWHVVAEEHVRGGKTGNSRIQQTWGEGKKLWEKSRFVVVLRRGATVSKFDLPPYHMVIHPRKSGSSERIRLHAIKRQPLDGLVVPEAAEHMERYNLYRGTGSLSRERLGNIPEPRVLVVADAFNPKAIKIKKALERAFPSERPNLIVVVGGDGTMFRAVREHWRKRLPFVGLNAGSVGFLMNDIPDRLKDFFKQEFVVYLWPLLRVETESADGKKQEAFAVNDAWVQVEMGKTGRFLVSVNGKVKFRRMTGDGLLVATPAGSTAYARAMGATPMPRGLARLVVVGSNVSHPVNWRYGEYLPLDSIIEFRNADQSGWRKMYGLADDQKFGEVTRMRIRASRAAAAEIFFTKDNDVQKKLARTQFRS